MIYVWFMIISEYNWHPHHLLTKTHIFMFGPTACTGPNGAEFLSALLFLHGLFLTTEGIQVHPGFYCIQTQIAAAVLAEFLRTTMGVVSQDWLVGFASRRPTFKSENLDAASVDLC